MFFFGKSVLKSQFLPTVNPGDPALNRSKTPKIHNESSEHINNLSHTQFFLLVLSSNLEKNMSHMTGAGSSAGAAAASAASAAATAATTANAVVPMQWQQQKQQQLQQKIQHQSCDSYF